MTKASARAPSISGLLLCIVAAAATSGCNHDGSTSSSSSSTSAGLSLSGEPGTRAAIGRFYSFAPVVNGPTSSAGVGFSIQNKPMWATFDTSSGRLIGYPNNADIGNYPNIVISASTGSAQASLAAFTITVSKAGTVTLNWTAPTTNTDGTPVSDIAGYKITYGAGGRSQPQSAFVANARTSYTFQNLSPGVWHFAVSAYTTGGVQGESSAMVSTSVD